MFFVCCSLEACGTQIRDPAALFGLKLTALKVLSGNFNEAWLEALCAQGLPLTSLELRGCHGFTGVALGSLLMLAKLLTYDTWLSDAGLSAVCGLPKLVDLEVRFAGQALSEPGLVQALRMARHLESFTMDWCKQVCSATLSRFACPGLHVIIILLMKHVRVRCVNP